MIKNGTVTIIAGGAGFIGCTLAKKLLDNGESVAIIDNCSRGSFDYLKSLDLDGDLTFIHADLSEKNACRSAFEEVANKGRVVDVWHLAANSDIPAGIDNPRIDLKDTFQTTFEILECMRELGIENLHFASSSAIYGDHGEQLLFESIGPLLPISNYGAMKLASEAQISAAAETFLKKANIFRFPNVVGVPATHGVILDLMRKLKQDRRKLDVLGNGTQKKSYLHVSDLVNAMLFIEKRNDESNITLANIGPIDEGVTVRWIAENVRDRVSPSAELHFGTENRGWIGDVPKFLYSVEKLVSWGWRPELSSSEAIVRAIDEIALQEGL